MDNLSLKVKIRPLGKQALRETRKANQIPAVLYGHGVKNLNLGIDYLAFEKVYQAGGGKGLLDLVIDDGKPTKVLIQDFQLHPLTNRFHHIDFRQVKMDEKIKTNVNLHFVGEAPAVKELGGIFVKNFSSLPVECLPQDLVSEITADISGLKEFGNVIHVKDIVLPPGLKILAHTEDVVATVTPPRVEEEAAAPAPAVDLSHIKTEAEEKKEKKAAEEGVEAAAKEEGKAPAAKPAAKKEEKK